MTNFLNESGDPFCRVQLPVRLDTLSTPEVQEMIDQQADSIRFLILDFSQCTFLSSNGIRLLVMNRKKMTARQGLLLICGLNADIQNVLRMAGMLDWFEPLVDFEQARQKVEQLQGQVKHQMSWENELGKFHLILQTEKAEAGLFSGQTLASLEELGFSFGMGANWAEEKGRGPLVFVTTPGSLGGYEPKTGEALDFRLPADPSAEAIALDFAICFPMSESGQLRWEGQKGLGAKDLFRELFALEGRLGNGRAVAVMLLIKHKLPGGFGLSMLFKLNTEAVADKTLNQFERFKDEDWLGVTYRLEDWPALPGEPIARQLDSCLTYENIISFGGYLNEQIQSDAEIRVFYAWPDDIKETERLQIETSQSLSAQAEFLVRKLYADAASVKVEGLHGGYSAQTFQVASFDNNKRRMRPTVMKIASKPIIAREAERCRLYALPYIFNNSAIVLGAQFLNELGALRYNFVGVGGENSKLKWLTHYYHEKNKDFLIPLFDKIFQTILKPWYGQAVAAEIYPFQDHDPTFTFFPHIFTTAYDLFGISPEDQYFTFEETGQRMLNPYWFLKHEYHRRRNLSIQYYSGICHGDLNMQNILLDENFNVYLIDFSETCPRSIISDFARLEAIFLIDNSPIGQELDLADYVMFMDKWFASDDLLFDFPMDQALASDARLDKNVSLAQRMRTYAVESAQGERDALAYYFALLEWIFPIICYTIALPQKKCALAASSILCSRIQSKLNSQYD